MKEVLNICIMVLQCFQLRQFCIMVRRYTSMNMKSYMEVEDLDVYRKLCQLHLEVCDLSHQWPAEECYE